MKKTCKRKITYRIKELLRNKLNFISRFIFKLLDDQSFTLHCINGLDYKYTRYQISLYLYTHIYVYMLRPIKYCIIFSYLFYQLFHFVWLKMKKWTLAGLNDWKWMVFCCIFRTMKSTKQGKVFVLEDDTPKLISSCKKTWVIHFCKNKSPKCVELPT